MMFTERRGEYTARGELKSTGWWTIYVSKNGEPIHAKTFTHNEIQNNQYMCASKAIDEAKDLESESV